MMSRLPGSIPNRAESNKSTPSRVPPAQFSTAKKIINDPIRPVYHYDKSLADAFSLQVESSLSTMSQSQPKSSSDVLRPEKRGDVKNNLATSLKRMHNAILQCSIIAKTLAFHQKHKSLKPSPGVSVEQLAGHLEVLEKMSSSCVQSLKNDHFKMIDSNHSRTSALNESREGVLAEVPKHLPPGRKTPRSGSRQAENLICIATNDMSTSEVQWQASDSSPQISSNSSLEATPREEVTNFHVEIARQAIQMTKLGINGSFGPAKL